MHRISSLAITTSLLLIDRLTKFWAGTTLDLGVPRPIIGNAIRWTRVHNAGGAFGIFQQNGTLFLLVSAIVSALLLGFLLFTKGKSALLRVGVSIVLAGAIGNLIDRAAQGYVLDFFEIRGFPVFNVADSCITIGAALIIIHVLFGGERDRSSQQADRP